VQQGVSNLVIQTCFNLLKQLWYSSFNRTFSFLITSYYSWHIQIYISIIFVSVTIIQGNSKWLSGVLTTATLFSRCNPMWFLSMGLHQGSGLCSSSSRKYHRTEGMNQNCQWNHHRWHATVWNELNYRVDVCRITKGAHIEHP